MSNISGFPLARPHFFISDFCQRINMAARYRIARYPVKARSNSAVEADRHAPSFGLGFAWADDTTVAAGDGLPVHRAPKSETLRMIGLDDDDACPTSTAVYRGSVEMAWEYSSPI